MVKTSAPTQVRAPFPEHLSMTATYNPQAAADQARATYREVTARLGLLGFDTAIPESVLHPCREDRGPDARGL